jgi:two-component system chemotaxis response regulator CheB
MSEVKVVRQRAFTDPSATPARRDRRPGTGPAIAPALRHPFRVLGIGASTGGPNAVVQVLSDLGRDFARPILLTQHMIPTFLAGFASWIESMSPFRTVIAHNGAVLQPGTVYLAPPDHHLEIDAERIRLTHDPVVSMQRPSATVMFRSMARTLGGAGAGVLLTGMGDDGADGLLELRRAGGFTIAEHESTAVVYGMPKAAVDRGAASECLPLGEIAPRILELISAAREA